MNCLDPYRGKLLAAVNRDLRAIVGAPDEQSIHRFRVGVKRLTALYRFLDVVKPEIAAQHLLKPARKLSRSISKVRDCHITLGLITELAEPGSSELTSLQPAVHARIHQDYRAFVKLTQATISLPLRLATIRSMKLSESAILRHKPEVLQQLLCAIADVSSDPAAEQWHAARILLKRYGQPEEIAHAVWFLASRFADYITGQVLSVTGESFLRQFALPNFFFHVTMTYALLRHGGVELGKLDYLGAP